MPEPIGTAPAPTPPAPAAVAGPLSPTAVPAVPAPAELTGFDHPIFATHPEVGAAVGTIAARASSEAAGQAEALTTRTTGAANTARAGVDTAQAAATTTIGQQVDTQAAEIDARAEQERAGVRSGSEDALTRLTADRETWIAGLAEAAERGRTQATAQGTEERLEVQRSRDSSALQLRSATDVGLSTAQSEGERVLTRTTEQKTVASERVLLTVDELRVQLTDTAEQQRTELEQAFTSASSDLTTQFEAWRLELQTSREDAALSVLDYTEQRRTDVNAILDQGITRIDEVRHTEADALVDATSTEKQRIEVEGSTQREAVKATAESEADRTVDAGIQASKVIVERANAEADKALAAAVARADQFSTRAPAGMTPEEGAKYLARNKERALAARAEGQRQASQLRGEGRAKAAQVSGQAMQDAREIRAQGNVEAQGIDARTDDLVSGLQARSDTASAEIDVRADAGLAQLETERTSLHGEIDAAVETSAVALDAAVQAANVELVRLEEEALATLESARSEALEAIDAKVAEGEALLTDLEGRSLEELNQLVDGICADITTTVQEATVTLNEARDAALAEGEAAAASAEQAIEQVVTDVHTALADLDVQAQAQVDLVVDTTAAGIVEVREAGVASVTEWSSYAVQELQLEGERRRSAVVELATERRDAVTLLGDQLLAEIDGLAAGFPRALDQAIVDAMVVFDAVLEIEQAAGRVSEEDGQERDEATVQATDVLAEQLEQLPPHLRGRVMAQVTDEVGIVADNLGPLSMEETREAVANLTRAGESLGREDIELLTEVVAKHVAAGVYTSDGDGSEFDRGLEQAIVDGHGAMFGASLTEELYDQGHAEVASYAAGATELGIHRVMEDYEAALAEFDLTEAQIQNWVLQNGPLLGGEAITAGENAYRDEHLEVYERLAELQARYGTLLPGVSLAADEWGDNDQMRVITDDVASRDSDAMAPDYERRGYAVDGPESAVDRALYQVTSLGRGLERDESGEWVQGSTGAELLTFAMLQEAEGHETFLTSAVARAERFRERQRTELGVPEDEEVVYGWDDQMSRVLDAASVDAQQTYAMGSFDGDQVADFDLDGMARVLKSWGVLQGELEADDTDYREVADAAAAHLLGVRAQLKPEMTDQEVFELVVKNTTTMFDNVEASTTRLASLDAMAESLAFVVGAAAYENLNWANRLSTRATEEAAGLKWLVAGQGDSELGKFAGVASDWAGALGDAAGLIGSLTQLTRDPSYKDVLDITLGATTAGQSLLSLGPAKSQWAGAGSVASKLGRASVVLAAGVSILETAAWIEKGDYQRATLAALPALGTGIGAAVAGPPGAAVGLALGSTVQLIAGLFVRETSAEERYELATESAWEAALATYGLDPAVSQTMAHELRNVDEDWVGAGPMLALVAQDQGIDARTLFTGMADIAARDDGAFTLQLVVSNNLLDADITNWDEVVRASRAALTDPTVNVPPLTYDAQQMEALGDWLMAALETDGDSLWVIRDYSSDDPLASVQSVAYNELMRWPTEHPGEEPPQELIDAAGGEALSFADSPVYDFAEDRAGGGESVAVAELPAPEQPKPTDPYAEAPFEAVSSEDRAWWERQAESLGYLPGTEEYQRYVEQMWGGL
ncbi:MAG: hypothetical protein ABMA64_26295 [Myxococcota bacterium]